MAKAQKLVGKAQNFGGKAQQSPKCALPTSFCAMPTNIRAFAHKNAWARHFAGKARAGGPGNQGAAGRGVRGQGKKRHSTHPGLRLPAPWARYGEGSGTP